MSVGIRGHESDNGGDQVLSSKPSGGGIPGGRGPDSVFRRQQIDALLCQEVLHLLAVCPGPDVEEKAISNAICPLCNARGRES